MADKKALVVRGGWDGHEPKQTSDIFAAILADEGFEVDFGTGVIAFTNRQ